MICIASSAPRLHPRPMVAHSSPSVCLSFVAAHTCKCVYTHVRTYHTYIRARSFSRRRFTPPQDTFLYNPVARALFSLYGDVVRNTYVTPKLIRYNFTGCLRSSIYSLFLRRCRTAGWDLTAAPTANQSAALPAPVIGFPRFSQLFLKSCATLFFPVLAPLPFDCVPRARVASRKAGSARGTIDRWMRGFAVDSLSSDAPIALFRCEGSLERLKKLNCAFIVNYLGSCLNVSRKQPARLLKYSVTLTTIHL